MIESRLSPDDIRVDVEMIIDGRPATALSGATYCVEDPATGRVVGSAPLGGREDAALAMAAAGRASDAWKRLPVNRRADVLERCVEALAAERLALARLLTREQGKPVHESEAEIGSFIERLRAAIALARLSGSSRIPVLASRRSGDVDGVALAHDGITVALVAWNFPIGLLSKKVGPTLLAGGCVVVKPAFTTPLATCTLVRLFNDAGLPPGVLSCVTGEGHAVGRALASHAMTSQVHLTGNDQTGATVRTVAAGAQLVLELAGSDPMIVCRDANLSHAVSAAVVGRFRNAGQACTAVKRLYVAEEVFDDFLGRLCDQVRLLQVGNGLDRPSAPFVRMGPLHSADQLDCVAGQLRDALASGASLVSGGGRPTQIDTGHFFEPTIVTDVSPATRLVTEEVFGPVLPVVRTRSVDEAIALANSSPWRLNASVWTSNVEAGKRIAPLLNARRRWVNRLSFGVEGTA